MQDRTIIEKYLSKNHTDFTRIVWGSDSKYLIIVLIEVNGKVCRV